MIKNENREHTNFLLNMKTFHNLWIKTYPHKVVRRDKEFSQEKKY